MIKDVNLKMIVNPLIVVAALSVITLSCAELGTEDDSGFSEEDTRIRFSAYMNGETFLKGSIPTTNETLDTIGLFAAYIPVGEDPDKLNLGYMMNVPYYRIPGTEDFDTSPARYWPVAGNMTFFALTPYDRGILNLVDMEEIKMSKYPTIPWGPHNDPKKQVDICVAVAKNQPRRLTVPLEFHHATSQIYFAGSYVKLEENEFIVIDSVEIQNIIGKKNVTITAEPPYVVWQSDKDLPRTEKYVLTLADGHLKNIHLPQSVDFPRGEEISSDDGRLYLVPQSYTAISKDIELRVVYSLWYEDAAHGIAPYKMRETVLETAMPECTWEADKRYRVILEINDVTKKVEAYFKEDEYVKKVATYFPMVCSFSLPVVTKTVGDTLTYNVTVGPNEVPELNQEVDWFVDGVPIDTPASDAVASVKYKKMYDGTVPTSDLVIGKETHKIVITCLKVGTCTITARTRFAASEDTHKEASFVLEIEGKGVTFETYPSSDYGW